MYSQGVNISSFHTHTHLCKHASGTPLDYVKVAAAEGCSALGISDHCPLPDTTWSGSRMSVDQLPLYIQLVEEARLRSPFPVYRGFECEWAEGYRPWLQDFLREELASEFLVYGPHWVPDNGEYHYIADVSDHRLLHRYTDLTVQGIGTGLFDFIAHPDLFLAGFTHLNDEVRSCCLAIIDAAVAMRLPMEVNGLGLNRAPIRGDHGYRSPYPVREFWEMAAGRGAIIIFNADAHRPQDVLLPAVAAREFARSCGIEPLDSATALGFIAPPDAQVMAQSGQTAQTAQAAARAGTQRDKP